MRLFSVPCSRALAKSVIAVAAALNAWSPICGCSSGKGGNKKFIGGGRFKGGGEGGVARFSKVRDKSTSV